jgi:DNA-binding NtrC family response regulator
MWYCPLPGELALPPRNEGTLLLNDVARLRPDQQLELFEWLSEYDRAQIISLTELPLFSIVSSGHFLESLYYRLNVIRLDVAHDL